MVDVEWSAPIGPAYSVEFGSIFAQVQQDSPGIRELVTKCGAEHVGQIFSSTPCQVVRPFFCGLKVASSFKFPGRASYLNHIMSTVTSSGFYYAQRDGRSHSVIRTNSQSPRAFLDLGTDDRMSIQEEVEPLLMFVYLRMVDIHSLFRNGDGMEDSLWLVLIMIPSEPLLVGPCHSSGDESGIALCINKRPTTTSTHLSRHLGGPTAASPCKYYCGTRNVVLCLMNGATRKLIVPKIFMAASNAAQLAAQERIKTPRKFCSMSRHEPTFELPKSMSVKLLFIT
ncbi:hypothetical protein HYFRA_00010946 [Hymenoscyphus fraxineus]|uniref:Uncharacterized protein n=1 Tax=Hymenoscyphus fraxineus TaxID=746836 RepID=A0A9N9KZ28_9HELO|nr:hypothetical protein HYFRA_00010946 [Hymenoscyphus fraxineus]